MHGIGNDYVYIDCFKEPSIENESVESLSGLAVKMSNRNYGVGSDGLILIKKGDTALFRMMMFNSDGTLAEMCGNGLRCVAKYLYDENYTKSEKSFEIETDAGIKRVEITKTDQENKASMIRLDMGKPILEPNNIPIIWKKKSKHKINEPVINERLPVHGHFLQFTTVSMGNPHCVIFLNDREGLNNLNIKHYGKEIEYLDMFPNRTNVEFVYIKNNEEIFQRTWERGAGETLACGTGASASVVASILNQELEKSKKITVHLKGGDLNIEWDGETDRVYLEGSATRVFDGEWLLTP